MAELVYETERASLYLGTAEDVAGSLPAGSVDLLVTDPPYGQAFKSNRSSNFTEIVGDDGSYDPRPAIATTLRGMRRYGHAYVFGPFDFSGLAAEGLIQEPVELVWDKSVMGPGNLQLPWGPAHEPIQFLVAVRSLANVKKGEGRLTARQRRGSVLRHQRPHAAGAKRHPSEKPVPLLRELVESSSVPGATVFDPYAGSGSTLVAALLEGRRAIGVELDQQYIEPMVRRLEAVEAHLAGEGKL